VWNEDENDDSKQDDPQDDDDEMDDRLMDFSVEQTQNQDEGASLSEGFSVSDPEDCIFTISFLFLLVST
jgi:hypothetical protein